MKRLGHLKYCHLCGRRLWGRGGCMGLRGETNPHRFSAPTAIGPPPAAMSAGCLWGPTPSPSPTADGSARYAPGPPSPTPRPLGNSSPGPPPSSPDSWGWACGRSAPAHPGGAYGLGVERGLLPRWVRAQRCCAPTGLGIVGRHRAVVGGGAVAQALSLCYPPSAARNSDSVTTLTPCPSFIVALRYESSVRSWSAETR